MKPHATSLLGNLTGYPVSLVSNGVGSGSQAGTHRDEWDFSQTLEIRRFDVQTERAVTSIEFGDEFRDALFW